MRAVLDGMSKAATSIVPLMPQTVQTRWHHLRMSILQLRAAHPVPDSVTPSNSAAWTTNKIGRSRDDIEQYVAYLRRSLVAVVNGTERPPDAAPPVLHRVDMAVWLAPDEGGPAEPAR